MRGLEPAATATAAAAAATTRQPGLATATPRSPTTGGFYSCNATAAPAAAGAATLAGSTKHRGLRAVALPLLCLGFQLLPPVLLDLSLERLGIGSNKRERRMCAIYIETNSKSKR